MTHFLTISNLNRSKGTWVLLEACHLLKERGLENFRAHFVGAATAEISEEEFRQSIEARGLSGLALYHGRQYGEDKERLLQQADVFVHPTLNDCFPLVLLEAMQHGLPIISTPVGAIPDMVEEGVNGILVEPGDAIGLAEVMQGMIESLQEAERMGQEAQERFLSQYTVEQFEENLINLLTNCGLS